MSFKPRCPKCNSLNLDMETDQRAFLGGGRHQVLLHCYKCGMVIYGEDKIREEVQRQFQEHERKLREAAGLERPVPPPPRPPLRRSSGVSPFPLSDTSLFEEDDSGPLRAPAASTVAATATPAVAPPADSGLPRLTKAERAARAAERAARAAERRRQMEQEEAASAKVEEPETKPRRPVEAARPRPTASETSASRPPRSDANEPDSSRPPSAGEARSAKAPTRPAAKPADARSAETASVRDVSPAPAAPVSTPDTSVPRQDAPELASQTAVEQTLGAAAVPRAAEAASTLSATDGVTPSVATSEGASNGEIDSSPSGFAADIPKPLVNEPDQGVGDLAVLAQSPSGETTTVASPSSEPEPATLAPATSRASEPLEARPMEAKPTGSKSSEAAPAESKTTEAKSSESRPAARAATKVASEPRPVEKGATSVRSSEPRSSQSRAAEPKVSDPKTPVSKSNAAKAGETKAVEAKVSPAKPAESKVAVSKVPEAKASEPKVAESKVTDNKATDSKPAEAKSNAGKVGDNKATEPKSAGATKATESKSVGSKSAELKSAEPKSAEPKSAEPKSAEPKSADSAAAGAKAGDSKSPDTKAAVTKTNESKNAEAKSAESKPSERKLVERGESKAPKATDTKQTKTADPKPSVVSSEKDAEGAKARVKAAEDKSKPIARPADPKTKPTRPPARPIAAAARIPVRAPQGKPAPRPDRVPTSPNPLPLETAFAPGAPFAAEESVSLAPPLSLDALSPSTPSTPSIASTVDADTFVAPETPTELEISGPPSLVEESVEELVEAAPINMEAPEETSQADSLAFESVPMVDVADAQASLEVLETVQPAEELPNAEEPATLHSPPLLESILVNDSDPGEAPVEAPPAPALSVEPEESATDPVDGGSAVGEEPVETKADLSVGEDSPTENGSSAEAFTSDSDAQLEDSGQLDDSNALNGFDEDDEDDGPVIYLADGNRKCIWHPCQNAARPNSKYCSRNCSNKNARARHAVRKKTRRKPLVSN